MKRRTIGLAAAVLAIGCSDADVQGPGAAAGDGTCAAMIDQCLVDQKACVETTAGPACAPCETGAYAARSGSCEPIGGVPLSHDFEDFTVASGEEVLGLCQSWTLGNATELWVNAVELVQDEASHHSNWTYVPSDLFEGPDGVWPCKKRDYSQLTAALAGGVLYAQSTQAAKEVQKFPNGAAIRIPPWSRVIGDVHLLNTTGESVTGHAHLSIYSVPADEVKVKLAPFHLTYDGLDIPPHARSRFTGSCELGSKFPDSDTMQLKLYYALPHTHALGRRFFLEVIGGPRDGESLIDVADFNSEARGRAYDPTIDLTGATGLRFGCEFDNPRDVAVKWGFGDQEMCETLGFADSPIVFESRVDEAKPGGAEGSTQLFTGECSTLAVPWNNNKPGGPPP